MVDDEERYVLVYDTEWMSVVHNADGNGVHRQKLNDVLGEIRVHTKLSEEKLAASVNMITQLGVCRRIRQRVVTPSEEWENATSILKETERVPTQRQVLRSKMDQVTVSHRDGDGDTQESIYSSEERGEQDIHRAK